MFHSIPWSLFSTHYCSFSLTIRHPESQLKGLWQGVLRGSLFLCWFQCCKALPGFFLRIFSSLECLKKPVFAKRDLLWWKVRARLYWDVLTQWKVSASLSLFLKSEKISARLYEGKGPGYTGPSVIFNLFPQPTRLGHRSQIMEGPVLRPVSSYLIYKFTTSVCLTRQFCILIHRQNRPNIW